MCGQIFRLEKAFLLIVEESSKLQAILIQGWKFHCGHLFSERQLFKTKTSTLDFTNGRHGVSIILGISRIIAS